MTADFDFDDTPIDDSENPELEAVEEEQEVDEAPANRRSPLRIILLVLLILVLLCVLCFLAGRFLPIPGIPGLPGQPTATPVVETPTEIPPTNTAELPTETPTETPVPTGEGQLPTPTEEGQPPATSEPTPTEEGQPPATEEPTPTEEPGATATTEPVPGPTSTPAPTIIVTVEPADCENNLPPVADAGGPYDAMMGKGQAIVNFDGSNSTDPDGTIDSYVWDFGDNSETGSGATTSHGYTQTGQYQAKLTVTDNCGATAEATAEVTIVGPTPPADGTVTPTPPTTPPPPPPPGEATLGFCHLVQYRQTLSGIAVYYGIPLPILADVNGVSMEYFVIAGQGLFIPMSEIGSGPNVYEAQPGDTLNGIAYHCGLPISALAAANNLDPGAPLMPGQQLIIPLWRQVFP